MVHPTKLAPPAEALHAAFRRAGRVMRKVQSGDPALYGVLHHVGHVGPIRLTALAEHLMLDISTVSRHVRALEADGLLARQTDPDDGRASLLVVTPAGTAVLDKTSAEKVRMFEAATAGWRDAEVYEFVTMINRLADDLSRAFDLEPL